MESLSNAAKRKKRKTRKCLDEIRKRSRRTNQIVMEKDDNKVCEIYNKNIHNCMITNNRLTLRMFPKTIRSNTITRPLINLEHSKPAFNFDDLLKGKGINNSQHDTKVRIPLREFTSSNELYKSKTRLSDYCVLNNSMSVKENIVQKAEESKQNFDFSSMDELTGKSPVSIGTRSISTVTSTSTQSLHDDNGYSLYEEFMSEVPACLQQNTKLIQEDVMKKTKMLLQNLFIESCCQEYEENILKCIKNEPKRTVTRLARDEVVHDPMDYIRLSHIERRQTSGSVSASTSASPRRRSRSPTSATSHADTPLSVVIHDTPDYTYHPHRLN